MKPAPKGWPRITSALFYRDAPAAIDWLVKVVGFEVRSRFDGKGGAIEHSELVYGDGVVMVYTAAEGETFASPAAVGGKNTQSLTIYVDDATALAARARGAGCTFFRELGDTEHEPGWIDRTFGILDLEGHRWFFSQRL